MQTHSPSSPSARLSPVLLFALVFVEGFSSLGAEIVALRRLVPHLGSAITVTAPTIGFFLLALALGYQTGGRVERDFLPRIQRNFLIAAALIALGLAGPTVDALFAQARPAPLAYLLFVGGVLCPIAWLLGQTVPLLTNLLRHERAGARSGAALYWSTLGSFLGSISLSVFIMQWLGVGAAILICAGLLLALVPWLCGHGTTTWPGWLASLAVAAGAVLANLVWPQQIETAYATYRIAPASPAPAGLQAPRVFWSNNSVASLIDASEPPRYSRYITQLRERFDAMALRDKRVLVLGAGGFTLSHRRTDNAYLYVDIDPTVRELAERAFLGGPINGDFVATDARRFVADTDQRFDVIVVDAYSALTSIPAHLVTREFWHDTRRALADDGVLFANLIVDTRLASPYARNLLASIEAVYGRCAVEILFHDRPQSNALVQCFAGPPPQPATPYTDERNQADLDLLRSR